MLTFAQDSSYVFKVTLHQILDIYLRLCHNDGTDEPEALYITLSSKLAVNSELASLDAAAREGKGLSQIHTWDDYDDDAPTEEKAVNAEEASHPEQGPFADEIGAGQPVFELHEGTPEHEPLGDELHGADKAGEAQEEAVPEPPAGEHEAEAKAEAEAETEHVSEVQHEGKEVAHEFHQTDEAQSAQEDDQFEDRYDSEAQNTESSATLANERAEDAYGYAGEGAEGNEGTNDQHGEDTNCEDFDPEHNEADAPDDPDAIQGEFAHEENVTEQNSDNGETAHQDKSFHEAKAQYELEIAPAENLTGDVDDVSYDQSESTLQNAPQQDATSQDRTPEPEGDDFGAAEDLMQTPAKDHNDQHDHTEGVDEEQYGDGEEANEDELGASLAEPDGGDDFDDYYPPPDLEVTEAIELGGTDAPDTDPQTVDIPSTKRSREEDEEWDTAATVTPDIKRRRS